MPNGGEPILKRQITPKMCAEVVGYLTSTRRWSVARIAKTVKASPDFIRRVAVAKQSFEFSDLEALAKASRLTPHLLVFESIQREKLPADLRGLYDITRDVIESSKRFQRAMRRKTPKRRGARSKAA